jgi:hypothetical protein
MGGMCRYTRSQVGCYRHPRSPECSTCTRKPVEVVKIHQCLSTITANAKGAFVTIQLSMIASIKYN